ncbi:hypothetical protein REPUB_Repub09cG0066000 [Reevesia pubescens]
MENALKLNQTTIPTFHSNEKKTHQNPLIGSALHEALPSFQRSRGTRRKRNREYLKDQKKDYYLSGKQEGEDDDDDDDDDDEEKTEVKRKIMALQRIVPGGEALGVDKLFEETADYILGLQSQIKAMRVLSTLIEGLDKRKTKLGG